MSKSSVIPGFGLIFLLVLYPFQNKVFAVEGTENNVKMKASVLIKWYLPETLKEVSGICRVDDQRMACVQDELGAIFIYNLLDARIEKKIDFSIRVILRELQMPAACFMFCGPTVSFSKSIQFLKLRKLNNIRFLCLKARTWRAFFMNRQKTVF